MKPEHRDRYASLPKRNFRNAIIRLLEEQYKILGSHKVLQMVADDILKLHQEFYPDIEQHSFGHIVWRTTGADCRKPSYGTRVEDYEVKTVVLPLITEEDIESRIRSHYGQKKVLNPKNHRKRDIAVMARLIKSAYDQGGLLSGAELSVLLNRSLGAIGSYLREYHRDNEDILPTKGIVLDQGSRPTHKASIINLYEQGYPEPDIARITTHTLESVGRYLRSYKNIKMLLQKGFGLMEMVRVTGLGRSTIIQYRDLVYLHHPGIKAKNKAESAPKASSAADEGSSKTRKKRKGKK